MNEELRVPLRPDIKLEMCHRARDGDVEAIHLLLEHWRYVSRLETKFKFKDSYLKAVLLSVISRASPGLILPEEATRLKEEVASSEALLTETRLGYGPILAGISGELRVASLLNDQALIMALHRSISNIEPTNASETKAKMDLLDRTDKLLSKTDDASSEPVTRGGD